MNNHDNDDDDDDDDDDVLDDDVADEDEDDLDLYDFNALLPNPAWEDRAAKHAAALGVPPGWTIVKMVDFSSLKVVDEWLGMMCAGSFKRFGWSSNCAYSVAVAFEKDVDAVLFKLRWGVPR